MQRREFLDIAWQVAVGGGTIVLVGCNETTSDHLSWVTAGEFPLRSREEIDGIIRDVMWEQFEHIYSSVITKPDVVRLSGDDFLLEFTHAQNARGFPGISNTVLTKELRLHTLSPDRKTIFLNTQAAVWQTLSPSEVNRLTAYLVLRSFIDGQATYQKVEEYIERSHILPLYLRIKAHEGLEAIGSIKELAGIHSVAAFHVGVVDSMTREITTHMGLHVPDTGLTYLWQDLGSIVTVISEALSLSNKKLLEFIQGNDPRQFFQTIGQKATYLPENERYQASNKAPNIWSIFPYL